MAIIGAGSSGLAAVKALADRGLEFDCFELSSGVGGNWRYDNDNGRSAAYDSLHIDTSKERMAYSDLPMPEAYPVYPHHSQVLEYFESYAREFDLHRRITFRTRVERVRALDAGGYEVTVAPREGGETRTRRYGSVIVANGHHWSPRLPEPPGRFDGRARHSRDYRNPLDLAGRRVLIVGIGNSGVDIACDVARVAGRTLLSTRRGAWVVPRFLMGRPTDSFVTPAGSRLPLAIQRLVYRLLLALSVGDQRRYGVPRPDVPLLSHHPTLSSELLEQVAHGEIEIKPDVTELVGDRVRFADGSVEPVDEIVWATGYRIEFPFLDDDLLSVEENRVDLYGRVVPPGRPELYFVGLIQPLGAIMPLAELQARWVAGLLAGDLSLPDEAAMRRWIERDRRAIERRYVASPRHTIQVDFFPYKRFLERELRRG